MCTEPRDHLNDRQEYRLDNEMDGNRPMKIYEVRGWTAVAVILARSTEDIHVIIDYV